MWFSAHRERTKAVLLGTVATLVVLLGGVGNAPSAENQWLEAMTNAVRLEQMNEGPFWGTYEAYLAQLAIVRVYYDSGDAEAVYAGMNRFMDMLEERVNGISGVSADWLFDYCQYHDISRHIEKFKRDQFGTSDGLFRRFVLTALRKEVCHENDEKRSVDSGVVFNSPGAGCAVQRGKGR